MKTVRVSMLLPLAYSLLAGHAQAESSAWLSVAAGPASIEDHASSFNQAAVLEISTGLGTSPVAPVVLGGILRSSSFFGSGTDLGLLGRAATRGYALGDWGLALDAGGYERFWGVGSAGFAGSLTLGAPWGLIASLGGHTGSGSTRGLTATVGFDFARLTVFRTSGQNWWQNPFPIVGEPQAK